jgi:hypothetical protein
MFKKFLKKNNKKEIKLKTKVFSGFARSIGAIDNTTEMTIDELLFFSYNYLNQERVVTKQTEKEFLVFKDQYNRYLEYCIEKSLVKKEQYLFLDELHFIRVPDMSHIEVEDISEEIKKMDIDLDKLGEIFSKIKLK